MLGSYACCLFDSVINLLRTVRTEKYCFLCDYDERDNNK